jgi:hypothetical protein
MLFDLDSRTKRRTEEVLGHVVGGYGNVLGCI